MSQKSTTGGLEWDKVSNLTKNHIRSYDKNSDTGYELEPKKRVFGSDGWTKYNIDF